MFKWLMFHCFVASLSVTCVANPGFEAHVWRPVRQVGDIVTPSVFLKATLQLPRKKEEI